MQFGGINAGYCCVHTALEPFHTGPKMDQQLMKKTKKHSQPLSVLEMTLRQSPAALVVQLQRLFLLLFRVKNSQQATRRPKKVSIPVALAYISSVTVMSED